VYNVCKEITGQKLYSFVYVQYMVPEKDFKKILLQEKAEKILRHQEYHTITHMAQLGTLLYC
jgi:hypothetical protein